MATGPQFTPRRSPWAGVTLIVLALAGIGLFLLALGVGLVFVLAGAIVGGLWLAWQRLKSFVTGRPRNAHGAVTIEGRYRVIDSDERLPRK